MPSTSEQTKQYRRTFPGLITLIYANQRMTSTKAGRPVPTYSKQELADWMQSQPNFIELWDAWVASDYDKYASPSVDRKDNKLSYTLENIQLVTWRQNLLNQKQHQKVGKDLHPNSKAIVQITLDGVDIATFASVKLAARHIGRGEKSISNITRICEGKGKRAYGFSWRWA